MIRRAFLLSDRGYVTHCPCWDRALNSSTLNARPGWDWDLNGCGGHLAAFRPAVSSQDFGLDRYVRPIARLGFVLA